MAPLDSLKVQKGNVVAEFCASVAQYCLQHGKLLSIENPIGSICHSKCPLVLLMVLPFYRVRLGGTRRH